MKKHVQSGFSAIEGLLILIIVCLVGFIGWFVWNSQQKSNETYDKALSSSSQTANNQAKQKKYLTIKEWGIKIPLSEDIADLTYEYLGPTSTGTLETINFNTASLVAADPNCASGPLAGIGGLSRGDHSTSDASIKIGSYYYTGISGGTDSNYCSDKAEVQTLIKKQVSALSVGYKNIQKVD